jgi:hypothetical protein
MIKMKTYLALAVLFCLLITIFLTKDTVNRDFFASLGIVVGCFTLASFSDDEEVRH